MTRDVSHLHESVLSYASKEVISLRQDICVNEAMNAIRNRGVGEKVIYFYVIDEGDRLVGVLPLRRLLTSPSGQLLSDIMIKRVVAIPHTATLLEACEFFVLHKLLAFPVVDERQRIIGVVDVGLFAGEVFGITEQEKMDEVFEAIGFRVSQVRDASVLKAFRFRFPWLLATITSGIMCALLASIYEVTLAQSIVLAFFLALVLGLGESVSIQSMTVTIQALRATRPTFQWYAKAFRREGATALLLGGASGAVVALIVWLWRGAGLPALVIGFSITISLCMACLLGLSVPAFLHALKLDPKIAAGPVTLALSDIFTLLFYLTLAALVL